MLEEDMMQAPAQEIARLSQEVGRLSACILELRRQAAEAERDTRKRVWKCAARVQEAARIADDAEFYARHRISASLAPGCQDSCLPALNAAMPAAMKTYTRRRLG